MAQTRDGLSLEMLHVLALTHPDDMMSLPSLFTFLPELILPPGQTPAAPYGLPFSQPSTVRAYPFILQTVTFLPTLFSHAPPPRKPDHDLIAAACLYLVHSYPCLTGDGDDDLMGLQELVGLAREFGLVDSVEKLTRLHSDVMKVIVGSVRVWRKRMKKRRDEVQLSGALFTRHVRKAEEDVTRRVMQRVKEQDAVMAVANLTYDHTDADTQPSFLTFDAEKVEAAFGEVEPIEGAAIEVHLDERKERPKGLGNHRKSIMMEPKVDLRAVKDRDRRKKGKVHMSPVIGEKEERVVEEKVDVKGEYEQEKAEEDADSSQLHFDEDRLREVCHSAAEKMRLKAAEEREKKEKKAKKKGKDAADAPKEVGAVEAATQPIEAEVKEGGEEDDDDVLLEDEGVQCEEAMQKFVMELRRLFRNACETEEATNDSSSPSSPHRLSAASPSTWLLSKVHFGRLVRKYKLLNKTCSAQFIEALWEEIQTTKRGGPPALVDPVEGVGDEGSVTFDEFLECLIRIASAKWATEASLYDRVMGLLSKDLFPALKGPSPLADFRTTLALTCEPVFDKHNKFLSQTFRAYSSDKESSGGVQEPAMTRKDFDEFIEHTQLLQKKVIAVRTVSQLWGAAQMDEEGEGGDGALFGGNSSMVFWEFLESIAALACYYERDPFLPIDTRLEAFVEFLQDGCVQVETKRRVYAAKQQGGGGGAAAGGAGAAVGTTAASKGKGEGNPESSPTVSRPGTANARK